VRPAAGFDVKQLQAMRTICQVPLVASAGGAPWRISPRYSRKPEWTPALAASVFHSNSISIRHLKRQAARRGVPVRYAEAPSGRWSSRTFEGLDFSKGAGLAAGDRAHAGSGAS